MIRRALLVGFGAIVGMRIATRMSHNMREQLKHTMREHCTQLLAGGGRASPCRLLKEEVSVR